MGSEDLNQNNDKVTLSNSSQLNNSNLIPKVPLLGSKLNNNSNKAPLLSSSVNSQNDDKIKKSLKYSIVDGSAYSAMVGFGESFISPFAVFLNATSFHMGLLGSLPQTLGSISQIFSHKLLNFFKSRKKMVLTLAILQGLMFFLVALTYFMGKFNLYFLIFFACLYWVFGMLTGPAWNSWIGDLVNEKERGSYFGKRNKFAGFTSFVTFMLAGYFLQFFNFDRTTQYIGFCILFALAIISRIVSITYLIRQYEPKFEINSRPHFTFYEFVTQSLFKTSYGWFVLFMGLMNFAVYVSGPFFTPYMLNELHYSYFMFTIITAVSIVVKFLSMPLWGKIVDKYGNVNVIYVTGFVIPFIPALWLISKNPYYLFIPQALSGFVWAGFELATFNYIFDSTTPQKRTICVSYYSTINGILVFLGAMAGTLLIKFCPSFILSYFYVFIISSMLRLLVSIIFIPRLKERRVVETISHRDLIINSIVIEPTQGFVNQIFVVTKTASSKVIIETDKFIGNTSKVIGKTTKKIIDETGKVREEIMDTTDKVILKPTKIILDRADKVIDNTDKVLDNTLSKTVDETDKILHKATSKIIKKKK